MVEDCPATRATLGKVNTSVAFVETKKVNVAAPGDSWTSADPAFVANALATAVVPLTKTFRGAELGDELTTRSAA